MRRPTFLVLGAAKCGTTSLCALLEQHPDVFLSEPKEPLFFELEYDRGPGYYWDRYFSGWDGQAAAGEGRVYNLFLPYVAPRIRETVPDARLIVILRDPVKRAHSHWWHRRSRGYERRSFAELVRDELERLERGERFPLKRSEAAWRSNFFPKQPLTAGLREVPVLEIGHYAEQVRRYLELFPAPQLKVVLLGELGTDPEGIAASLWEFLGLEAWEGELDTRPRNTAEETVKTRLGFAVERLAWLLDLRDRIPKPVRRRIRLLLSRRTGEPPAIDSAVESRLREHYRRPNAELRDLLGHDPGWS